MKYQQHTKSKFYSLLLFALISLYRVMLDWLYFNHLAGDKHYLDIRTSESFIFSWLILVISFFMVRENMITHKERISALVITTLYLVSFVPFTVLLYAQLYPIGFIVYNLVYWSVMLIAQHYSLKDKITRLPKLKLGSFKFDERMFYFIGAFTMASVIYISWRYTNFRLHFDLTDVYRIRAEEKSYNMSKIMRYTHTSSRMIHPILCAYFITQKKYGLALAFFLIQILSFGIGAHKSEFFTCMLAVGMIFVHSKLSGFQFKMLVISGIVFITLAAILQIQYTNRNIIYIMIIRRIMFLPNLLHKYYYDFFITTGHEITYLKSGMVYFFIKYFGATNPYVADARAAYQIGGIYFNAPAMYANNGLASEAMHELGIIGAVIIPLMMIFILLRLLDRSSKGINKGLAGIATIAAMSFILSILSTNTVTFNIQSIAVLFLLSIMHRDRSADNMLVKKKLLVK